MSMIPSAASTPPLLRGNASTPSRLRSADALRGLTTATLGGAERGRSPRRAPQPKQALMLCVLAGSVIASSILVACTDGTTPDCSGNPSPCGYDLPAPADAGSQSDGGE